MHQRPRHLQVSRTNLEDPAAEVRSMRVADLAVLEDELGLCLALAALQPGAYTGSLLSSTWAASNTKIRPETALDTP